MSLTDVRFQEYRYVTGDLRNGNVIDRRIRVAWPSEAPPCCAAVQLPAPDFVGLAHAIHQVICAGALD